MLNEIIENKKIEVKVSKGMFPLDDFKRLLRDSKRDFKKALSKDNLSLIAEIKRKSPSKKIIGQKNALSQPKHFFEIIKAYDRYADAISVLTDKKFFEGSLTDMKIASKLTRLPILRKDFIIDEYQIYESRLYGADAILLIASRLTVEELMKFISIAKSYKMECLVEAHTEDDLSKALACGSQIIGINNRDLNTLKIDMETTLRLCGKVPKGRIIVSESGIFSRECIDKIKGKVNAVLVGTAFMDSKNIGETIKIFNL